MKRGHDGKWRTVGGVEVPDFDRRALYGDMNMTDKTHIIPLQERLDKLAMARIEYPMGSRWRVRHDGFVGEVCGHYIRKDGYLGVCLQLENARVVHVYGLKWLEET